MAMRRSFIGLALIFAFFFGAATGGHQDLLNMAEAAEEDAASEERDEEILRSRASSRARPRQKSNHPVSRVLRVGAAPLLDAARSLYLRPVSVLSPFYQNHRQPLLQVFQI